MNAITRKIEQILDSCPDPQVRSWIEHRLEAIVEIELPKLALVLGAGPLIDTNEGPDAYAVATVFGETAAMPEMAAALNAQGAQYATILGGGMDIAEAIDNTVRRALCGERWVNRMAYYDLLSLHAAIIAAISHIPVTEEEKAGVDRRTAAAALFDTPVPSKLN